VIDRWLEPGDGGSVLATDISPNLLDFAARRAREAGLSNVDTAVLDGEQLDVEEGSFDAVISRVGFIYFPDQPSRAASWPGSSTRRHTPTSSSPFRCRSFGGARSSRLLHPGSPARSASENPA
jgi:SAM-dependent methyltransferase